MATDLADYIVRKGLPFRQAHHAVGRLVALAEKEDKGLNQLTLTELQGVAPAFAADALKLFDVAGALARRNLIGAPAPAELRKQLARWRRLLD